MEKQMKYTMVLANGLLRLTPGKENLRRIGGKELDIHFFDTDRKSSEPIRTVTLKPELITGTIDELVAAFRQQLERQAKLLEGIPDATQAWGGADGAPVDCRLN
jgi:hypothetical protein